MGEVLAWCPCPLCSGKNHSREGNRLDHGQCLYSQTLTLHEIERVDECHERCDALEDVLGWVGKEEAESTSGLVGG